MAACRISHVWYGKGFTHDLVQLGSSGSADSLRLHLQLAGPLQEEGKLSVLVGVVVSIHVGIFCVFMFIFQGLDWLEAAAR